MTPQAGAELPLIDRLEAHARNADYTSSSMLCFEAADALRLAAPAQDREAIALSIADEFIAITETASRVAKRTGNTFVLDRQRVAGMIQAKLSRALNVGGRAAADEIQSSDGGTDGRATGAIGQRGLTDVDLKCQPDRQEGETTLPAGIKPGLSEAPPPQSGDVLEALRLARDRLLLLMPAELPETDHPVATRYVLKKVSDAYDALSLPAQKADDTPVSDEYLFDECVKAWESQTSMPYSSDGLMEAIRTVRTLDVSATPDTAPDGVREYQVPMVGTNELNDTVRTYCKTCGKLLSEERDV